MKTLDDWWQCYSAEWRLGDHAATAEIAFYLGAVAVLTEMMRAVEKESVPGMCARMRSLLLDILDFDEDGMCAVMGREIRPN